MATDFSDKPADERPEDPGEIIAVFEGTIVLRDPIAGDVSRANRPLVPEAPTVAAVERQIAQALGDGFAVTVRLTRTDK